tara:strand:+ start:207 stop:440 length:234 start_codon:yes stop_codon:yes gene_type:complete
MNKILYIILTASALSSCTFNEKAEAMPPVHTLYHGLSEQEKAIYNSFNAQERFNVNKNTYMHQLKQALDTNQYQYDY